jgi:uncharacterized protein (DUF488 family)
MSTAAQAAPTVFTIGHGARTIEDFLSLLQGAGIQILVDVRSFPGSRKHPHFGKEALAASLDSIGIAYQWKKELGGFRKARPGSRHTALTSGGYRGYADHMETEEFRAARDELIRAATESRTAVMCAESLWWKCHRRMLADALVAAGCEVRHIMTGGRQDGHRLHPAGRTEAGLPVYDGAPAPDQQRLVE